MCYNVIKFEILMIGGIIMNIDYPATLIKIRAVLNLSQMALANMLGVAFTSVNRWENGHHEPTRMVKEKIRLICKENNIEIEEVVL